ncbi:YrhB domain-containing protein [Chryseobacterium sp. JM1]|uniref:YrhB domain-containing protein n=1 Tax=Chryseobacterium sp. JM1 TaxID=1233950 RepID=UPI00068D292E|nr:YrhB domain-containing protein [Chryseobacterium sp. JM1]
MLTENEILEIAKKYIALIEKESKIEIVLIDKKIAKKSYGTIFFYTSKKWLETGDDRYAIAGNAPFLIESETGNIIEFGTAHMPNYYIEEYEAGRWPK